jgi:hypothetical protein
MRVLLTVTVVLGLVVAAAGPAVAAPAAPPADLLAVVTLPSKDGLAGVAAFADRVQPGAGAMVGGLVAQGLGELAGPGSLEAVAAGKPLRLLVLEPPGGKTAVAVVVPVKDAKALARAVGPDVEVKSGRGWAVLGQPGTPARLAPWALSTLVAEKAPAVPTASLFPAALFAAHRAAIEQVGAQMVLGATTGAGATPEIGPMMGAMVDGMLAAFEATARLDVTIDATAERLVLDLAATPRPGTPLAALVAAQRPSRFPLLDRLPLDGATVFVAGRFASGPYQAAVMKAMQPLLAKSLGGTLDDKQRAALAGIWNAVEGELAFAGALGSPMAMIGLYAVADPKAVAAHMDTIASAFSAGMQTEVAGVVMRTKGGRDKTPIDGVTFRRSTTTFDYSKLSKADAAAKRAVQGDQMEARWAVWDDVVGYVTGGDALTSARRLVAVSRGKAKSAPPPPLVAAMLDEARARRDSLIMIMDVAAVAAQAAGKAPSSAGPVAIGIGFADTRAHLTLTLPSASVTAIKP